jgi:hypothetical protein
VSLVEQELLTLPEHMSSPPVFSGFRVTRSLVLYVCFVDRYWSFCTFSFGHYFVCSSSINGLRLPLWYLQTLLVKFIFIILNIIFVCYHDNQKLNTSLYNIEINWLMKIKLCFNLYMHSIWYKQFRMFSTKEGSTSLIILTM